MRNSGNSASDPTRRRFIRETEIALTLGIMYPETTERIPTVEVGKGAFSRQFADEYWQSVLGLGYSD